MMKRLMFPDASGSAPATPASGTLTTDAPVDVKPVEGAPADKPVDTGKPADAPADKPADAPVDKKPDTPSAPEKYELKLPDSVTDLDPAITERTATIARTLGLSNDAAQKALDFVSAEIAARDAAVLTANKPGGEAWLVQVEGWEKAAKADPELGGDKFDGTIAVAKKTLDTYFPPTIKTFLNETGFGSHPDVIRAMVKIAKALGEDKIVSPAAPDSGKIPLSDRFYPTTAKKE